MLQWQHTLTGCCVFPLQTAIGANATTVLGIPIEFRHVSWRWQISCVKPVMDLWGLLCSLVYSAWIDTFLFCCWYFLSSTSSCSIGGYGSFQDVITLASKMFQSDDISLTSSLFHINHSQHTHSSVSLFCAVDIIKLFNPNLLGASPGKTVHGMQAHISETGFNLAVTGHNTLWGLINVMCTVFDLQIWCFI